MRIAIVLCFLSLVAIGQPGDIGCNFYIKRQPYFIRNSGASMNEDSLRLDMKVLQQCGDMDEADLGMLSGTVLGMLMIDLLSKEQQPTYYNLILRIKEFKRTKEYKTSREMYLLSKEMENQPADLDHWKKDKAKFLKIGLPEQDLVDFEAFLRAHPEPVVSYKEAFTKFAASKPKPVEAENKALPFEELLDLDHALLIAREIKKKPLLLYFTCYACVNSRKMEERVLNQEEVRSFITSNYVAFSAHVDSKKPAENGGTIGQKHMALQSGHFKKEYQPWFFILDANGNVVADMGYSDDVMEFMKFLEKGQAGR